MSFGTLNLVVGDLLEVGHRREHKRKYLRFKYGLPVGLMKGMPNIISCLFEIGHAVNCEFKGAWGWRLRQNNTTVSDLLPREIRCHILSSLFV